MESIRRSRCVRQNCNNHCQRQNSKPAYADDAINALDTEALLIAFDIKCSIAETQDQLQQYHAQAAVLLLCSEN